jgi:hypothetical protein
MCALRKQAKLTPEEAAVLSARASQTRNEKTAIRKKKNPKGSSTTLKKKSKTKAANQPTPRRDPTHQQQQKSAGYINAYGCSKKQDMSSSRRNSYPSFRHMY